MIEGQTFTIIITYYFHDRVLRVLMNDLFVMTTGKYKQGDDVQSGMQHIGTNKGGVGRET